MNTKIDREKKVFKLECPGIKPLCLNGLTKILYKNFPIIIFIDRWFLSDGLLLTFDIKWVDAGTTLETMGAIQAAVEEYLEKA